MSFVTLLVIAIVIVWVLEAISSKIAGREGEKMENLPELANDVIDEIDRPLKRMRSLVEKCAARHGDDHYVKDGALEKERIRLGMNVDLLHLFSYLAAFDGVVTGPERVMMKSVLGYVPDEEDVFRFAREVEEEMGSGESIFSLLCFHLVRLGCVEEALSYVDGLVEIGKVMLRETGQKDSAIALDLLSLNAKIAIQDIGFRYHFEDLEEEELVGA